MFLIYGNVISGKSQVGVNPSNTNQEQQTHWHRNLRAAVAQRVV